MITPQFIIEKFEKSSLDIAYGSVTLSHFIKDGRRRYTINREESFIVDEEPSPVGNTTTVKDTNRQ
jgi:hypothetical protein